MPNAIRMLMTQLEQHLDDLAAFFRGDLERSTICTRQPCILILAPYLEVFGLYFS